MVTLSLTFSKDGFDWPEGMDEIMYGRGDLVSVDIG